MRPVRASADPIAASRGDCVSLDIKTSTTLGLDNLKYTAVLASHRTQYTSVLHASSRDLFIVKLKRWYTAYNGRHAAITSPLLMFRADNEAALFPDDSAAF